MVHRNGKPDSAHADVAAACMVIIDGSNVAHCSEGDTARLENIELVMRKLSELGYEPVVLADAALRHQIDRQREFEQLVDAGTIRQAPAGTDADFFILSFARELGAAIVSNDQFRDRLEAFPETRDQIIRYMIVNGEVVFERRHRRRHR
ncbi:MAG: NYN domain-containing protein [Longimicrobiales bacterium]